MHSLVVLCFAVAAASAATPFFESPHNEHASAFYKVPLNPEYHHGGAPVHRPPPSYHSGPAHSYQHRPQPAYRPEHSHYQPSYGHGHGHGGHGGAGGYGGHGGAGGYGGHGATSFQTVRLGEPSYSHHNSHY